MKKILSILAAVGLTATASTAVVACGSSKPKAGTNEVVNIDKTTGKATYTVGLTLRKDQVTGLKKGTNNSYSSTNQIKSATKNSPSGTWWLLPNYENDVVDASKKNETSIFTKSITYSYSFTDVTGSDIKDGKLTKDVSTDVTFTFDVSSLLNDSNNQGKTFNWCLVNVVTTFAGFTVKNSFALNITIPTATK